MILSSIKSRLILLYSAVILLVLLILSAVLIISLKEIVYKPIDSNLLSKAKDLDSLIKSNSFSISFSDNKGRMHSFSFSNDRLWIYSSRYSKYFFQIRSANGSTLEKSISLGGISLPFNKGFDKFENMKFENKTLRLLNFFDKDNRMVIQVAYDVSKENGILNHFILIIFLSIIFIMLISALGGFIVSDRALEPIKDISGKINRISKENLEEKIDIENVPYELRELVSSFNNMLDRLNKAFKQQKRFISDVSHELKTPVSVLMMQSDVALKRDRTQDEYKKALETVKKTSKTMSNLIERMLLIAQLDSKYSRISLNYVDINEVIEESLSALKYPAYKNNVSVKFERKENCVVKGDKITLVEIFINLIDNAIKYNKKNGIVDISLKREDNFVAAEIKDSGIGISKDKLGKITEEFYRVDESRSKKIGGFGLGLSIAERIIKLHNGRIDIKSELNKGTSVFVYLPEK